MNNLFKNFLKVSLIFLRQLLDEIYFENNHRKERKSYFSYLVITKSHLILALEIGIYSKQWYKYPYLLVSYPPGIYPVYITSDVAHQ